MKTILYLSVVDWDWIKQRPQMIAEELGNSYNVICIYPKFIKKSNLSKNENKNPNLKLVPRFKLPFTGKSIIIKKFDEFIQQIYILYFILKYHPDYVYASFPTDYGYFLKKYSRHIVFDCMDNYSEFEKSKRFKIHLINLEEKLIDSSECVFVSSENLRKKINKRYNIPKEKTVLVRNGFSGEIKKNDFVKNISKDSYKIAYIGTVSSWFDFEALKIVTDRFENVEFHIIGPVDVNKPDIKNVIYDGVINHDELFDKIKDFDGLIMPFVINDIIEAVDPVKLYEYINFNLPIISVYYDEIDRFNEFVWFYNDEKTLIEAINNVIEGNKKYSDERRLSFLKENNWISRVELISNKLKDLDENKI